MPALFRTLVLGTAFFYASFALADPPPPKVCVAVAGDPDEAVRSLANDFSERVSTGPGSRGVADADIRAVLRGEPNASGEQADRARARRALRGTDTDATTLDQLAVPLGCAWFITLSSAPSGARARAYDVVNHRFTAGADVTTVDTTVAYLQTALGAPTTPTTSPITPSRATHQPPVLPTHTTQSSGLTFSRMWPWLVAGGAALGVIAAFILLQDEDTPSTTVTVIHRGLR